MRFSLIYILLLQEINEKLDLFSCAISVVLKVVRLLPTAYVVRREGYVLTRVCPSVCPHPGGGGYPSQVQWGRGTPTGGTPPWVPPVRPSWGYPSEGGYSTSGTPHRTWLGGNPMGGYPILGTPSSDLAGGRGT